MTDETGNAGRHRPSLSSWSYESSAVSAVTLTPPTTYSPLLTGVFVADGIDREREGKAVVAGGQNGPSAAW